MSTPTGNPISFGPCKVPEPTTVSACIGNILLICQPIDAGPLSLRTGRSPICPQNTLEVDTRSITDLATAENVARELISRFPRTSCQPSNRCATDVTSIVKPSLFKRCFEATIEYSCREMKVPQFYKP
tara:strand:+ start:2928 stop:3311 length:384 start_codon:yes stop_codon:yes gene_type:complete